MSKRPAQFQLKMSSLPLRALKVQMGANALPPQRDKHKGDSRGPNTRQQLSGSPQKNQWGILASYTTNAATQLHQWFDTMISYACFSRGHVAQCGSFPRKHLLAPSAQLIWNVPDHVVDTKVDEATAGLLLSSIPNDEHLQASVYSFEDRFEDEFTLLTCPLQPSTELCTELNVQSGPSRKRTGENKVTQGKVTKA